MVFEVFRRRQKAMIAVLAIFAMFAFVLADFFTRGIGNLGRESDRVIAKVWGQDLKASQVQQIQGERALANEFVQRAMLYAGLNPPGGFWPTDFDSAVRSVAIEIKAEKIGLVIDNDDVTEFINQITANKLTSTDFRAILSGAIGPPGKASSGRNQPLGVGERDLYRILARELLVQRTIVALTPMVIMDTPYDIWASREPTLTHIQLELARVPVDRFVDQVAEPTPEQIKSTFESYKDIDADPARGVVGFRIPRKIELQYLTASVDKAAEGITVTDDELKTFYEQHKRDFTSLPPTSVPPPPPTDLPPPPPPDGTVPPPPRGTDPSKESKESPPTDTPPAEAKKDSPPTDAPKDSAPTSEPPKSEKGNEAPSKSPSDSEEQSKEESKPQAVLSTPIRFLARLQTEAAEKASEAAKDQQSEPAKEKTAEPTDAKAAETPVPPPKESEAPAEKGPAPVSEPPAKAKATDTMPAPPETRIRPFEEVREQVSVAVRRQKARDQIVKNFEEVLRDSMNPYLDQYLAARRKYLSTASDLKGFVPPTPPDLSAMAQKLGCEYKSTGPMTFSQLRELEGLSRAVRLSGSSDEYDNEPFLSMVVNQGEYRGRILRDPGETTFYLYWKNLDEEPQAPSLDDVRNQVIEVFKQIEARPKARAEAEKLAQAVRGASGDFAKAIPTESGYGIMTTGLFPRLRNVFQTSPLMGADQLVPSTIPEVPNAGIDFLDKVFALAKGDIAVVPDSLERNFYVVKVKEKEEPDFRTFVDEYRVEMTILRSPNVVGQRRERQLQFVQTVDQVCQEADLRMLLPEDSQENTEVPEDS